MEMSDDDIRRMAEMAESVGGTESAGTLFRETLTLRARVAELEAACLELGSIHLQSERAMLAASDMAAELGREISDAKSDRDTKARYLAESEQRYHRERTDRLAAEHRAATLQAEVDQWKASSGSYFDALRESVERERSLKAEVESLKTTHQPRAVPPLALSREDLNRWRERVRMALPTRVLDDHFGALTSDHDLWHLEAQLASAALYDAKAEVERLTRELELERAATLQNTLNLTESERKRAELAWRLEQEMRRTVSVTVAKTIDRIDM
jgi:predicted  nucleic acid-binding Zn-ribbon protein